MVGISSCLSYQIAVFGRSFVNVDEDDKDEGFLNPRHLIHFRLTVCRFTIGPMNVNTMASTSFFFWNSDTDDGVNFHTLLH